MKIRAIVAMISLQLVSTGLQILSREILSEGSFVFALITYRHIVATLSIAPFAFLLERGKEKKMGIVVLLWLFLTSLTGVVMSMGMFYYGLKQTNAMFASNFLNLIPIVTYALSVICRMESLEMESRRGKVKLGGALLCVAGALTITLYKGTILVSSAHHTSSLHHPTFVKPNWTLGTLLLLGSCFSYAAWFTLQGKVLHTFPFKYTIAMYTCMFGTVESAFIGLCINRSKQAWKLQWDLQLITIIYSGVLASAVTFYIVCWTVANKGPTYVPMFNPLGLVFVALVDILFLGESFTMGSLLGSLTIIIGLYAFLWGRRGCLNKSSNNESEPQNASQIVIRRI